MFRKKLETYHAAAGEMYRYREQTARLHAHRVRPVIYRTYVVELWCVSQQHCTRIAFRQHQAGAVPFNRAKDRALPWSCDQVRRVGAMLPHSGFNLVTWIAYSRTTRASSVLPDGNVGIPDSQRDKE